MPPQELHSSVQRRLESDVGQRALA